MRLASCGRRACSYYLADLGASEPCLSILVIERLFSLSDVQSPESTLPALGAQGDAANYRNPTSPSLHVRPLVPRLRV